MASIFILIFHFNWKAAAAVSHETAVARGTYGMEIPRGLFWETVLALNPLQRVHSHMVRASQGGLSGPEAGETGEGAATSLGTDLGKCRSELS